MEELLIREGLTLPIVQPVNINSVVQAAHWLGAVTSAPALCFGRLQAGFQVFSAGV